MFPPLYLHFFDRELRNSVNCSPKASAFFQWLHYLLISSPTYFYCGASPVWETPGIGRFIAPLVKIGHLHLLSAHLSLNEFIESRRAAYAHVEDRYPLYYSDRLGVYDTLAPTHQKTTSATAALKRDLLSWSVDHLYNPARQAVLGTLVQIGGEALTFAFFESSVNSQKLSLATAEKLRRQISFFYTKHYLTIEGGEIATGIRGLEVFDDCEKMFPYFDIPILSRMLVNLGLGVWTNEQQFEHFVAIRGQIPHITLCEEIRICLAGLLKQCRHNVEVSGKDSAAVPSRSALRASMLHGVDQLLRHGPFVKNAKMEDMLMQGISSLANLRRHAHLPKEFVEGSEEMAESLKTSAGKVLLIVVTDVEMRAVLRAAFGLIPERLHREFIGDHTYYKLGVQGGCELLLVQCQMGSGGVGGSLLTAHESILALRPSATIMVGIAFGLKPDKQKIGDILVSKQMWSYEPQRVEEKEGKTVSLSRGDKVPATPRLVDRFQSGTLDWNKCPVKEGLFASGEKLVDAPSFVATLRQMEPEAIGGDMEGSGVCAAALKGRAEWILAKAVCDFGMNKNNVDKDAHQAIAAQNAAEFVFHVIRQGGLAVGIRY